MPVKVVQKKAAEPQTPVIRKNRIIERKSYPVKRPPAVTAKLALPTIRKRLLGYLECGAPLTEAAPACGLTYEAVQSYLKDHADFRAEVEQAKERGKADLMLKIHKHHDWRAAAWSLTNIHKGQFSSAAASTHQRMELALDFKAALQQAMEEAGLGDHAETVCRRVDQIMFPKKQVEVEVNFTDAIQRSVEDLTGSLV